MVLVAALAEEDGDDPRVPSASAARATAGAWVLSGGKTAVDFAPRADLFLVPASTADGVMVFLVSPSSAGVTERALELTAEYARNRVQFGRPIGSFQAVTQRLADAYVDVEAVRLTMWQAAWLLAAGSAGSAAGAEMADAEMADAEMAGAEMADAEMADAEMADAEMATAVATAVATAKFWAAEAGHRVAHTAVHVHGGLGIDTSYPVHRYFVAAKHHEFALGGATAQLRRIGAVLAGPGPGPGAGPGHVA